MTTHKALTLSIGDNGIAVVTLDIPDNEMNALDIALVDELIPVLEKIQDASEVKACIIISGKKNVFAAGADIKAIQNITNAQGGEAISGAGQKVFNQISASKKPIVAAIHGPALGGGYELALACHAIVASDSEKTVVGLPEVMLGLLPGSGGTQRLPKRIGLVNSLDILLTGKQIRAKRAYKLGMIDELVPQSILVESASNTALALSKKLDGSSTQPSSGNSITHWLKPSVIQELLLEKNTLGRRFVYSNARKKALAKTKGNYPAPLNILDCVEIGIEKGISLGLEKERILFGQLTVSAESKELVNLFLRSNALKKETFNLNEKAQAIHHLAILGGGFMGAGIAAVAIDKANSQVRIKDIGDEGLQSSLKNLQKYFLKQVKRKRISAATARAKMAQVTTTLDYSGIEKAELVIEAIFENLKVKQDILAEVEELPGDKRIFASNTSSLLIRDIAKNARHPENVIGMHYFSPVEKMPLLEIIRHEKTADWVTATCVAYGRKQGKTVIVVKDGAGFFVNRVLGPYINEAAFLFKEGYGIENIDNALVNWGFPVGPLKLMDEVGIDVVSKVQPNLEAAFGERMQSAGTIEKLIEDGRLGKKAGKGFYLYEGKNTGEDPEVYDLLRISNTRTANNTHEKNTSDIIERCSFVLINEAVRSLDDGTIQSARDGDLGCVYGMGFPPFRGGPFRFVDNQGAANIVEVMRNFESTLGVRFKPADLLVKMAKSGEKFYPS